MLALIRLNGWSHMELACLPADLHNAPQRIPEAVRAKIRQARRTIQRIFVLYGDCGTGGVLDQIWRRKASSGSRPALLCVLQRRRRFLAQAEAEPACFYLTDYLARHFERWSSGA